VLENIDTHKLEKILRSKAGQQTPRGNSDYFLPNFCKGRAVFALILVTELLVLTMALAASGIREFAWEDFALISLFVLWVALSSAALLCALRGKINRMPLPAAVVVVLLIIAMVTLGFSMLAEWAMAGADFSRFEIQINGYDLLRNLLVSLVMSGMALRYFYVQAQLRQQERSELHARIQALQSRINPHFLFNSMNSIASLISIDPDAAEQAVEDLCELFRASLRETTKPVALSQELELCRRYMAIEQLRLGERLRVDWQLNELPEQATLPLLTLQPVLENAVYHGIQPLSEGGEISVETSIIKGKAPCLKVRVSNPVLEAAASSDGEFGHQMALDNIRDRLDALYNGQARLETEQNSQRFVAELTVPFRKENNGC